ncbi:hypothetical protein [Kutzneria sp. NPDC051319]
MALIGDHRDFDTTANGTTIRHADGTWQHFGDVNDMAGPTDSGLLTIAS